MTTLSLRADPVGRRATVRTSAGVLRPYTLSCDGASARICLVPTGALLLAGDHVQLRVDVGPGAHLELVETAGTVAYDMRNASPAQACARWDVEIRVAEGGSLRWEALPFIVATGADVRRRTTVQLGAGAALWLRETLVLGRSGEAGGRVRSRLDVRREVPVLVEDTDSVDVGSRVVDSLLVIGFEAVGGMRLAAGGTLFRSLPDQTHLSSVDRDASSS
ncbi:MAG: hypothetical protein JWN88_283 [Frankiales bacterium]|jgi:urease accessory protein|nr:hypothetical protein [Frankiales bacterium]